MNDKENITQIGWLLGLVNCIYHSKWILEWIDLWKLELKCLYKQRDQKLLSALNSPFKKYIEVVLWESQG